MTGSKFWREQAACRLTDAGLFDPPRQGGNLFPPETMKRLARTAAVCRRCAVTVPCVSEARRDGDSGVRGGMLFSHGRTVDYRPARAHGGPVAAAARMVAP